MTVPLAQPRRGFTLLEVMVSIAMVLMLILGINQVFSLTSQTVAAGNVLNEAYRYNRSVQSIMLDDLRSMVPDAPALVIRSQRVYAFRNRADMEADADANAATNEFGAVPAHSVSGRSHRQDRIGFFARNLYHRQTGAGNNLVELDSSNGMPQSSNEAWVIYGHLWLPDNGESAGGIPDWVSGTTWPGGGDATTNPNNYFAGQWILGRSCTLLMRQTTPPLQGVITVGGDYGPLSPSPTHNADIFDARFDVAVTTMGDYRQQLVEKVPNPANLNLEMLVQEHVKGQPLPDRPLTSEAMAKTVPCFIGGCSQFIIEYAGDFITQDGNGNPIANFPDSGPKYSLPDGIVDFTVDSATGARRTCWYGFPRDANLDGKLEATTTSPDTMPLTRRLGGGFNPVPHERLPLPATPPTKDEKYIAAWGHNCDFYPGSNHRYPRPKMFRVILAVDDAGNRLTEAQTFEYVVDVP